MSSSSDSHQSPKQGEEQKIGEDSGAQSPNLISDSDPPQNQPSLTLETQIPPSLEPENHQNPRNSDDQQHQQSQQQQQQEPQLIDDEEAEETEPEAMAVSPPHLHQITSGNPPPPSSRRALQRKKGSFKRKHRATFAAIQKKLQALTPKFNPIPFAPIKALDFSKHAELLKRIGLWGFAHLEFDINLRADLVAQLIASYNKIKGICYVNETRISVNRPALARALNLTLPHSKKPVDLGAEELPVDFLSFVDEFVSNWMLLHDDTWVLPDEILKWMRLIKDGQPEKVDWAGLVWFMLEKELAQGPQLINCYYASHLQLLIKSQRKELLEPAVANDVDDVDFKMGRCDEMLDRPNLEEQITELSLGQMSDFNQENIDTVHNVEKRNTPGTMVDFGDADNVDGIDNVGDEDKDNATHSVKFRDGDGGGDGGDDDHDDAQKEQINGEDGMNFGHCRGKEHGRWLFDDGKINGEQHILQQCNVTHGKENDDQRQHCGLVDLFVDDEAEEDEQAEDFSTMQKCSRFDGLSSENLMQGMVDMQMPFTSELCDQSSLQLLSRRTENNTMLGGTSLFGNSVKREIDHDAGTSHHDMDDNHKRMRVDGQWAHSPQYFDSCMEQIQHWAGKARIAYEASREESSHQANMTQQYLVNEVANKDHMIRQLKCQFEELQKRREDEITRFDNELHVMTRLIDGYRRALKDTRQAFADYRKKCPQLDEPIYKDAGVGGVVKSVTELEKERIKRQEEERMMLNLAEELVQKFEMEWDARFKEHSNEFHMWCSRLSDAEKEVKLLRKCANRRVVTHVSDT
ncbi:hypothetical protein Dimus_009525 [Dionaea muscipula]